MDSLAAVSPFRDPFEELQIIDPLSPSSYLTENPTLDHPANNDETMSLDLFLDHEQGQELNGLLDPEDPLSDPVIWALCNNADDVAGAGTSGFAGQGSSGSHGVNDYFNVSENQLFGENSMLLPPQSQYNCTFCQRLREITHTDGMTVKRLEIHGRFGVITHAVLGIYDIGLSFPSHGFQMFDFHKESTQMVKEFLVQYFGDCRQEGYSTVQDPLSTFYEALCVGLNVYDDISDCCQSPPENTGDRQNKRQQKSKQREGGSSQVRSTKIPLKVQRARTKNLKAKDFISLCHLPIEQAAMELNLSPTVIKKICRRDLVPRWPYRKKTSLEKKIEKKQKSLEEGSYDNEDRERVQEEIQTHQQELAEIYASFNRC